MLKAESRAAGEKKPTTWYLAAGLKRGIQTKTKVAVGQNQWDTILG